MQIFNNKYWFGIKLYLISFRLEVRGVVWQQSVVYNRSRFFKSLPHAAIMVLTIAKTRLTYLISFYVPLIAKKLQTADPPMKAIWWIFWKDLRNLFLSADLR